MSQTTNFYLSWLGTTGFGMSGIRLRDQEPIIFQPTDISGCAIWMDANDNDAVVYNDLLQVSQWKNKGTIGGAFDASGAGIVEYGKVKQNGLNTVSFKEYGFLSGALTLNFQSRSIFVVVKPNSFPLSTGVPILTSATANFQDTFFIKNGTWTWVDGKHLSPFPVNTFETSTDYTGYASIAEFVVGTDLSDNWSGINGAYIAPSYQSAATYATGSAIYFLGNYFNGSPVQADIDFCEILVYDSTLSEADRENVEAYLQRKWNIQEPPPPPPVPFVPSDISGLWVWMDANNQSTITIDAGSNVLSWSNLGLASNVFSNDSNFTKYAQDANSNWFVAVPTEATLATYTSLPYLTRTSFVVFENVSDLTTITYPYENLFVANASGGVQLGVSYDSNAVRYYMTLCQNGINCPVVGEIPSVPVGGYNLGIWACDSNTTASNYGSFNGGSNLNISTDLGNLFNTFPIPFSIGSPVFDSPSFRVGEIIEYDSLLSPAQVSTVASYLVTKWAISSFVTLT